jgi:hypothetical protein
MKLIDASSLTAFEQSLLDIGIKVGVFAALLILSDLGNVLSSGAFVLPYPTISLPLATLVISQLDSLVINYASKNDIPTSNDTIPPPATPSV